MWQRSGITNILVTDSLIFPVMFTININERHLLPHSSRLVFTVLLYHAQSISKHIASYFDYSHHTLFKKHPVSLI